MQFFVQELYSHIDKNSGGGGGGKSEDMFLVKLASKVLENFNMCMIRSENNVSVNSKPDHPPGRPPGIRTF